MEKLYFVLSLVLISIITVVNIESGWRFIEIEFLTAMLVMAPEFISGLVRDIVEIVRENNEQGKL